jgi:hypothetical protein
MKQATLIFADGTLRDVEVPDDAPLFWNVTETTFYGVPHLCDDDEPVRTTTRIRRFKRDALATAIHPNRTPRYREIQP